MFRKISILPEHSYVIKTKRRWSGPVNDSFVCVSGRFLLDLALNHDNKDEPRKGFCSPINPHSDLEVQLMKYIPNIFRNICLSVFTDIIETLESKNEF